jgi:hypothetical protein
LILPPASATSSCHEPKREIILIRKERPVRGRRSNAEESKKSRPKAGHKTPRERLPLRGSW